jgi:hypothetical protein
MTLGQQPLPLSFFHGYTGERTECEGDGFSSGLQLRGTNPKRISNCNDLYMSNRNTDSKCLPLVSRQSG